MNRSSKIRDALGARLEGSVSIPGETGFETARTIWPRSEARPAFIVHCRVTKDVRHAIQVAQQTGLPLSVRGGGHDWAGRALCDGIVLDLSPMRDVMIASDRSSAWVGGGARGQDLFVKTDPAGVAAATGSVGLVGLAGLTLGGGYGPLLPHFGLACDNLVGAEVVLADGSIVRADPDNDADLLWALRGGGGGFGVATALHLKLHRLPSVRAGILLFPLEQAAAIFDGVAAITDAAPDALEVQVGIIPGPQRAFLVAVVPTWSGPADEGETHIAPLVKLGTPVFADVRERPYGDSRSIYDQYVVNGLGTAMQTRWLPRIDGDPARILIEQIRRAPSPLCSVVTHEFRGAASRIAPDATAFGFRRKHVLIEILAQTPAADAEAERRWVLETAALLDPFAFPGAYANMLGRGEGARASASFGPNADRLRAAKQRFDPMGIFRSAIPLPV